MTTLERVAWLGQAEGDHLYTRQHPFIYSYSLSSEDVE